MLQSIIFIIVAVWFLFFLYIYIFQSKLIYIPNKILEATPSDISLDYEDITLMTSDEIDLNAWWIPHPNARATVLFLHGNAGNISHRLDTINILHKLRLSVLIVDYRGYGKSMGRPSEQGTYIDAETAWNYLTTEKNIASDEIIIFGRSLGGAVAAWLAERYKPALLIVESSFTSMAEIGKHHYPYLPIKLMTRIKYTSIDRMPNIDAPVLIIHSADDDFVPYKFGKLLFKAAKQPKVFLDIDGYHNNGFLISGDKYSDGIDRVITNTLE